jgi:L-Ala-D/L-Glu epimerase
MEEEIKRFIWKERLLLKKPFKIAHGSYNYRENVFFLIKYKSLYGIGEAAVVPYYGHTSGLIENDLRKINPKMLLEMINGGISKEFDWDIPVDTMPARCAIESALIDILSQIEETSIGDYLGVFEQEIAPTSYTVTGSTAHEIIDDAEKSPTTILKVKAGVGDDLNIISILRRNFPGYIIRMDVNQGWTISEALRKIEMLESLNIELIEEPIQGSYKEMESIAKKSIIPVFLDESFHDMTDLYRLRDFAPSVKGIVVKLAKTGGPLRALSLILAAHQNGLVVMISSMVETSVGVSIAASIAPLCKYVDLDSPYLFEKEPFSLLEYRGNKIHLLDNELRSKKIRDISAELIINE